MYPGIVKMKLFVDLYYFLDGRIIAHLEFSYRRDLGIVIQLEEVLVLYENLTDVLRLLFWNWLSEETLKVHQES